MSKIAPLYVVVSKRKWFLQARITIEYVVVNNEKTSPTPIPLSMLGT